MLCIWFAQPSMTQL